MEPFSTRCVSREPLVSTVLTFAVLAPAPVPSRLGTPLASSSLAVSDLEAPHAQQPRRSVTPSATAAAGKPGPRTSTYPQSSVPTITHEGSTEATAAPCPIPPIHAVQPAASDSTEGPVVPEAGPAAGNTKKTASKNKGKARADHTNTVEPEAPRTRTRAGGTRAMLK